MNFLEQLVAEWYEYRRYFVLSNLQYGKRKKGGYEGEIDVLAFHPKEQDFLHIETSADALSWAKRRDRFRQQFTKAARYYPEWLPCNVDEVKRIAVVGFALKPKVRSDYFGDGIEIRSVPDLMAEISAALAKKEPMKAAVPEAFPLLRAVQFAVHYGGAATHRA